MDSFRLVCFITLLGSCLLSACSQTLEAPAEAWQIPADAGEVGEQGMVSSAHPLATQVGLEVLKRGGNAFDAAIAVNYALAVVYPVAGNLGGGGFLVYRKADGEIGSLDYREMAPAAAARDMYLDQAGDPVAEWSRYGHKASGVPGTVAGMEAIFERLGSLPREQLLQPAIDLAEQGFELTENEADRFNGVQKEFRKYNRQDFYYLRGEAWEMGDRVQHLDLAKTLARIRDNGQPGFYEGETADLIVEEMKAGGGLITHEDLKEYEAKWREPITGNYKGHRIISMPPPSSGGVALLQLLEGAEAYPVSDWGHNSAQYVHLMVELERRVYADRATYLGDMDFFEVPLEELIDSAYIHDRMASISLTEKTNSQDIKPGEVDRIESFETTHFSIVDKEGNAVAITTTLNSYFGSKVMVQGAGFFLNNEMDDFSAKPGVPNQFGLVGGEANAIQPGKRMLSSMTPTIVEKDGELHMVVGTPGGATIITCVFQTILNVLEFDMGMQAAVDAKKIHSQWLPDQVYVETRALTPADSASLRQMGHELTPRSALGRMDCILVLPNGWLEGGADHSRGDNTAMGY
ncbi:MAG: gamma-glutamyltransferase [Bacteroidota bacterium]